MAIDSDLVAAHSHVIALGFDSPGPLVAAGAGTIAVETAITGFNHNCPCQGQLSASSANAAGWAPTGALSDVGNLTTRAFPNGIALDAHTLAAGAEGAVLMVEALPRPIVRGSTLTGLTDGRPPLLVDIAGEAGDQSIKSVDLAPPDGLRLTHDRRALARALRLTGAGAARLELTHGSLMVTLRRAVRNLALTLSSAGLVESVALQRAAVTVHAFNRRHGHKHRLSLPARLRVNDAAGDATSFTLDLGVT